MDKIVLMLLICNKMERCSICLLRIQSNKASESSRMLVKPLHFLQVVGGSWLFSRLYCNIFVMLDVMMCTASILNLCAISIDR